jgi:hypothetical protein
MSKVAKLFTGLFGGVISGLFFYAGLLVAYVDYVAMTRIYHAMRRGGGTFFDLLSKSATLRNPFREMQVDNDLFWVVFMVVAIIVLIISIQSMLAKTWWGVSAIILQALAGGIALCTLALALSEYLSNEKGKAIIAFFVGGGVVMALILLVVYVAGKHAETHTKTEDTA